MKYLYVTLRSIFLFYFVASMFSSVLIVERNTFSDYLIPSIFFGIILAALPAIVTFFKFRENTGALLLVGIITIFAFYFIGYYAFNLFQISGGTINFGSDDLVLTVKDQTMGLIFLSILSSGLSVILEVLSNRR